MRATIALHWQALLNKIHPPLPLTPRQSQRVLKALNSSLQDQLDQQHPLNDQNPATDHVQSLLGNPLFLKRPVSPRKRKGVKRAAQIPRARSVRDIAQQEPLVLLQDVMAQGRADPATVKRCLGAQLNKCSAATDMRKSMADTGAGTIILQWLWSSGNSRTLRHLTDTSLTRLLIKFLVAERKLDEIGLWLKANRTTLGRLPALKDPNRILGQTLLDLIISEIKYGAGLTAALNVFHDYLSHSMAQGKAISETTHLVFGPAGRFLTRVMADEMLESTVKPPDYEKFINSAKCWAREDSLEHALLSLYHPSHPGAGLMLSYLGNNAPTVSGTLSASRASAIAQLTSRAAKHLNSQGKQEDAIALEDQLQTVFPKLARLKSTRKFSSPAKESTSQEDINMQLLEGLAPG